MEQLKKVVIIGSGCAGWTAALYTARADLETARADRQTARRPAHNHEHCRKFPRLSRRRGRLRTHDADAKAGRTFRGKGQFGSSEAVDFSKNPFALTVDGDKVVAETVIIATGASHKHLGVTGEDFLETKGVTYCATCDGALPVFATSRSSSWAGAIPRAKRRFT